MTADATADPAQAAVAQERLGLYLFHAGRIEEALRARASAVALVPAEPPTRLRARVTAAMAQALINAERQEEARRWCDEALKVARAIGSAEEEADILVTQAMIEEHDDPASARPLYAAGRARAAEAGNPEIESRALQDLAWLEFDLGNLAAARAVFDEGVELTQRTGLGWSDSGSPCAAGSVWFAMRQVTGTTASGWPRPFPSWRQRWQLLSWARQRCWWRWAAGGLQQPSACATSPLWPAWIPSSTWRSPAWRPTRPSGKVTSNEPARPSNAASPSSIPAKFRASPTVENAWICAIGLVVQAELAERARTAGDAGTLSDAIAAGHMLLERARTAVEQTRALHGVDLPAWHAKAEAEWSRLQGRSDPKAWLGRR